MKSGRFEKMQSKPEKERGWSLITVMAMMALIAIALMAVAPSILHGVQREKELEAIRRGEEVAEAIRQYVEFHQGRKLPDSIDELLEGLPAGTKKRQILRPSAAIDPLSQDGKWRLIRPDSQAFLKFGKRVQVFNNGLLPSTPGKYLNRYAIVLANVLNTEEEDDLLAPSSDEYELSTENTPFIGVSSQSKRRSILTYYGVENHSKWLFTPMFRGTGGGISPLNRTPATKDETDDSSNEN